MVLGRRISWWHIALGLILILGLMLRLKGLHNPVIDHPGWRQGDESAIARNFANLQLNPLYPQTDYNGPPPNYVELELQIVPFLAALLYKIFGVHEVFGRLISMAFSLGTIAVIAAFGRWLFFDTFAGLAGALLFAILPGSVYYGRTFMPDTTMVFFMTAALYAASRYLVEDEVLSWRGSLVSCGLLALALLAKPVAAVALVPAALLIRARMVSGRTLHLLPLAALVVLPIGIFAAYDRFERSIAEWHWASGITTLHVLPSLRAALTNGADFVQKWRYFESAIEMLSHTMLGPFAMALAVLGFLFLPRCRSRELVWGWLVAALAYAFVVVTVERVDYYLYVFLPLAALAGGAFVARLGRATAGSTLRPGLKNAVAAGAALVFALAVYQNRAIARPYYAYSKVVYRNATALNRTLAPGALVVMGHYDPSVLYYINRKGWQEDPYLWTPFDEQSAIRKGARYFIAIERNRFEANAELYNWMQRFPVLNSAAAWPVYETASVKMLPHAEARWKAFRRLERALKGAGVKTRAAPGMRRGRSLP